MDKKVIFCVTISCLLSIQDSSLFASSRESNYAVEMDRMERGVSVRDCETPIDPHISPSVENSREEMEVLSRSDRWARDLMHKVNLAGYVVSGVIKGPLGFLGVGCSAAAGYLSAIGQEEFIPYLVGLGAACSGLSLWFNFTHLKKEKEIGKKLEKERDDLKSKKQHLEEKKEKWKGRCKRLCLRTTEEGESDRLHFSHPPITLSHPTESEESKMERKVRQKKRAEKNHRDEKILKISPRTASASVLATPAHNYFSSEDADLENEERG